MQLNITGHGIEVTPALDEFIHKKFSRIQKHGGSIISVHVTLKVDKFTQTAEVTAHLPGIELHAQTSSEDMYQAIDLLTDKLIRQLDKHREKQHHQQ